MKYSEWKNSYGGSSGGGSSTSTYRKKKKKDDTVSQSYSSWREQNPNAGAETDARINRSYQNWRTRQEQTQQQREKGAAVALNQRAIHEANMKRSKAVEELVQWSRNVRVSDANTTHALASQAQDFQTFFSEYKDAYDKNTLNQVQSILKNGQNILNQKDPSLSMNGAERVGYINQLRQRQAQARDRRWNGSMMENRTSENYDTEKDAETRLNALRAQNLELKRQKKLREYEQNAQGLDATYRTTANGKERQVGFGGKITESGFDDPMYDLINKNKDAVFARQANASYADAYMGMDDDDLQQMNEQEVALFNALYSKDKKQAYEYIKTLRPDLRARQAEFEKQQWAERAEKYPILTSALSVPNNLMSSAVSLIGMGAAKLNGEEIDPNAGYLRGRRAQTAIRGTVGQMAGEALTDVVTDSYGNEAVKNEVKKRFGSHIEKLGETTYGSVMSMLDNLFNVALVGGTPGAALTGFQEAASLALMSTTAMPDTIVTAKEHGMSDKEAFGLGVIAGVAEYFTEKVSLDALFDMESIAKEGFLRYVGKAAFTEGSEEVASDFINFVAQEAIAGQNSDFNRQVKEYQQQGMSHEQAVKAAWADQVEQAAMSFFGGAVAGGGAAVNLGTMNQISQNRMAETGADIKLQNPDNAMIQRMGDAEVAQMAYDQQAIKENEEIGVTAIEQAAEQMAEGGIENVNPALTQTLMQNPNALDMLEEATGSEEITDEQILLNAIQKYAVNEGIIESPQEAQAVSTPALNAQAETSTPVATQAVNEASTASVRAPLRTTSNINPQLLETGKTEAQKDTDFAKVHELAANYESQKMASVGVEIEKNYDDNFNAVEYNNAVIDIVDAAVTGKDLPDTVLPVAVADTIYKTAQTEGSVRYGGQQETGSTRLRGFSGRLYGEAAAQRGAGVAEGTGEANSEVRSSGLEGVRRSTDSQLRKSGTQVQGNKTTARGLNLPNGTDDSQVNIVDTKRLAAAEQEAADIHASLGNRVHYYEGGALSFNENGTIIHTRGVFAPAADGTFDIYARSDSRDYSGSQIVFHETMHADISAEVLRTGDKRSIVVNRRYKQLCKRYSEEFIENFFLRPYKDLYIDSPLKLWEVKEEMLADLAGGMNELLRLVPHLYDSIYATQIQNIYEMENERFKGTFGNTPQTGGETSGQVFQSRDMIPDDIRQRLEEKGVTATPGGTVVRFSQESWNATDKVALKNNLIEAGFTDGEVKKWIKDVNGIANTILGNLSRYDYIADPYQKALKDNNEYYFTLDLSTLCKKRRLYQGTLDAIMHELKDRYLTDEDLIRLRQIMEEHGYEDPCGICYEESRKKNEQIYAERWMNGSGKWKGYKNMQHDDPYIPEPHEYLSVDGRAELRKNHPEALESYEWYMRTRGPSNPKLSMTHTDYRRDIMNMTEGDIEKVKHIGGLRVQSYSDFETVQLIDMMQAVMDMAARGLTSQAYTKVPEFADIFGGTGIKINLSLIGQVKNGKLVFDSKEGIDPKKAFRIRKKYSNNVGTIIVGANDESILAEWADPRIDMVIPFHLSGWKLEQLERLGLKGYVDYTEQQTEKYMIDGEWKSLDKANEKLGLKGDEKMVGIYSEDYWNKDENGNYVEKTGKENAEAYLKLCAEKGYRPVFYKFLHDNGDGTWSLQKDGSTDGYWKSLVDFKMYNNDGTAAPQQEVRPIFNMRAANKAMREYTDNPNTLPVADDVVKEFVKEFRKKEKDSGVKNSRELSPESVRKMDRDYMTAVENGDMETAQRMVDEAAKAAGWRQEHMFHGSLAYGFNVFDKAKAHVGGNSGAGFYFSSSEDDSDSHYADIEGADNFFKAQSLAERIVDAGEWDGIEVTDYDKALEIAKKELDKTPGTYNVYLKYDNPFIRDFGNSTNLYDAIMDDFDESTVDRDDYENDEAYEEDLHYYQWDHFTETLYSAIRGAYSDIEDMYDVEFGPYLSDLVDRISGKAIDYQSLGWKDLVDAIEEENGIMVIRDDWDIDADASSEFARAIIENLGFDAIVDYEVSKKFGQLSREMMDDTYHTIVFKPNQIKSAGPITLDDDGNVIPLSERFNTENQDIRYSMELDSEGRELSEGQQKYFKESKVRDAEGNLLAVYHGSPATDITVFDRGRAGEHTGAYSDRAIWFTTNQKFADDFAYEFKPTDSNYFVERGRKGKVYPVYLNITNPFDLTNPTQEMKEILYRGASEIYKDAETKINELLDIGNHQLLKRYLDFDELEAAGYDGIIAKLDVKGNDLEYGIFNSNQAKDVANLNPTEDEDIRYSQENGHLGKLGTLQVMSMAKAENATMKEHAAEDTTVSKIAKDTLGNVLSQGQRKYFKNSKMVDENGNLKVMYHGTMKGGFSIFNPVYSKDGISLFFTDDREVAESYTRGSGETIPDYKEGSYGKTIYPVYLNITNPMIIDAKGHGWKTIPNGEAEVSISERKVLGDFAFTSEADYNSFNEKYDLENLKRAYEEAQEEGSAEYNGEKLDEWELEELYNESISDAENEYRRYYKNNSSSTITAREFFENYEDYGWYELEALQDTYDESGPTLTEIKEAADYDYESAVQIFEEYLNERIEDGELEEGFLDELSFPVIPRAGEEATKNDFHNTRWYAKQAAESGYDGVIIKDVYDRIYGSGRATVAIVFDSNQVKSVDNMNPTDNQDIRYSRELEPNAQITFPEEMQSQLDALDELREQYAELQKENKKNASRAEYFKGETKLNVYSKNPQLDTRKIDRMAKGLIKDYGLQMDLPELKRKLLKYAEDFHNGGKDFHALSQDVLPLANEIVRTAKVVMDTPETEIIETIKKTKIKVSEKIRTDIPDYGSFRKEYFGVAQMSTLNGIPVEDFYRELQASYGTSLFPDDVMNPTDQLYTILETASTLQPQAVSPFTSYDMANATQSVAIELMNDIMSMTPHKTFADKQVEARNRLKKKMKAQAEKAIQKVRDNRDEKIRKLKEHNSKVRKNAIERRKATVLRNKIKQHVSDLSNLLLKPTDKRHIPQNLQPTVAKLLESINLESVYRDKKGNVLTGTATKRTVAFQELQAIYAEMAKGGHMVIDPDLMGDDLTTGLFAEIIAMNNTSIMAMNSEQLSKIWRAVRAMENAVRTANKLFAQSRYQNVSQIATVMHDDNVDKTKGSLNFGKIQKLVSLDMLTPEAYFHRLGDAGDYLFKEMRKAQDESITIYNEAVKYGEENLKGADFRKLEKEMHQVTLGGQQIKLSTAQLMELYLLIGRDQAKEHILNPSGGLRLRDVKKGAKIERHPDPIKNITAQEISDAMALLSPQQIAWAESMQKYVSGPLADHGNKASMQVYGYEKFTDDNYWKITSNEQDVRRDIGRAKGVITSVSGKGMAQPLTPKANTSIMLGSIFDTYSNSVMEMADYAAWLATMEDINRVRNYQAYEGEKEDRHRTWTMQQTFDRVFGDGGAKYLETLMSHLANGVQSEQSFFGGFTGNYKAAAIGFNIRVVIQQPTAIFRAMDMISPKYLLSAMASRSLKGWKEAKKYSPIALWKDWGFFDVGTGRQMKGILFKDSSALEKVKSAGMWLPGQADSVGWGWLWNAVKKEVKATTDLEGEAYYKRVAKRFNDIVDHTQVVDGVLQRPDIMRRSDSLTKMAVSFMAEPMKQYNMLVSAVYDSRHATGDKLKAAKRRVARSAGALLIAGIINAVAQSIVDGLRNSDRDKDYWEKFLAALLGDPDDKKKSDFEKFVQSNFGDMLNVAGYIPFAKDILSLLEGYDVSRMDMDAISESIKSAQAIVKASNGEGKDSLGMAIVNACGSFGQLLGISFKNIKREALAVTSAIVHGTGSYVAEYHLLAAQKNINSTTKKEFIDLLIEAHDNDKKAYKYLYNEYIKNKGFATSKLSAREYVNDKISKHEEAQTTAKNRTSAGLTKKDIARYEKALKAHDEDKNDKPNKDEIYYTLMEIDMSMKQKETLWAENGYTHDKKPQTLREYDAIMKKKK